ncbi:MAG: sucrose phosphorylase [Pseudomonadota bacterium]
MKNAVQLICYADRLGGTLPGLRELLSGPLAGLFGGVHVLPFYHPIDGADAGFDPIDHTEVDPRLGSWKDVQALAGDVELMADVIVNHMSCRSPQFLDYSARGSSSAFDGMFLTVDNVFPGGASEQDLLAIYRPRPGLPFTPITLADGSRRILWTTFTAEQIDLDLRHPQGARYLDSILAKLAHNGVRMIRLDAVGYAVKRAGSSCFMMPETFTFISDFSARASALGLEVLVEIHSHYEKQIEIARHVGWVYDFALPPLVLHAFFSGTAHHLKQWIAIRPRNALTVLDTHDGIGVIDVGADAQDPVRYPGLIPQADIDALVETIHRNSHGESQLATGAAASNLDLYQVNCTFHDALGRDDRRYLLGRAIQFFLPGIPQVYYVGLLAGHNDMELLGRTHVGRDINRRYYTPAEINEALQRPVVQDLLGLIRLRNTHPAFAGNFQVLESSGQVLELQWTCGAATARLRVDLKTCEHQLECRGGDPLPGFRLL